MKRTELNNLARIILNRYKLNRRFYKKELYGAILEASYLLIK